MRAIRVVSVALTLLAVLAVPARAGDLELPPFGGEDLLLKEGALPEGWKMAQGEEHLAAIKPVEDAVKEILAKEQIDELDAAQSGVVVKNASGEVVALSFLDVDAEPKGVPAAVKAVAQEKGWHYQELGTPLRILVATGPEAARAAAVERQIAYGAAALTELAMKRMRVQDSASQRSGRRLLKSAMDLAPKAPAPHALMGFLIGREAAMAQDTDAEKGKKLWAEAIKEYRQAFSPDAVGQVPPAMAYQVLGDYALALLSMKTPEANAEAKKVLLKAVELEENDPQEALKGNNRYNLACALSLLGEKAEAIKHLDVSLATLKKTMEPARYEEFVKTYIPKDADLDNIRNEPGYKEVMDRAAAEPAPSGGI